MKTTHRNGKTKQVPFTIFPKRYRPWLSIGAEVIYYKGRIKDKAFAPTRLSVEPHYFGMARIGKVYADESSEKGDLFALIENFTPFERAVPSKTGGEYLETIPTSRLKNYWRDGVRPVSQADYDRILSHATLLPPQVEPSSMFTTSYLFQTSVAKKPSTRKQIL